MPKRDTSRDQDIHDFVVAAVVNHPLEVSRQIAEHFGIPREQARKHLRRLIAEGVLHATGNSRMRMHRLADPNDPQQRRERARKRQYVDWKLRDKW